MYEKIKIEFSNSDEAECFLEWFKREGESLFLASRLNEPRFNNSTLKRRGSYSSRWLTYETTGAIPERKFQDGQTVYILNYCNYRVGIEHWWVETVVKSARFDDKSFLWLYNLKNFYDIPESCIHFDNNDPLP